MASQVIQARIPDEVIGEAKAVIKATGLSVSDVMRMVMTRIATEKTIPLDFFQPNTETIQAMREAAEGKTTRITLDGLRSMILSDDDE